LQDENQNSVDRGSLDGPFVFPDAIYEPRAIDGAAFLFFDNPLILPLPPLLLTDDAFDLVDLVDRRQPSWGPVLHRVLAVWDTEMAGWQEVERAIDPVRAKFSSAMFAYPADEEALSDVDDLIAAAGLTLPDVVPAVDPICACGELVLHIFLEAWLEHDEDLERLYGYCERIFADLSFESLLMRAYFFRTLLIARFQKFAPVLLLNNPRLAPLLRNLPVEPQPEDPASDFDVITWELFRQILSPYVDPLNYERAEALADILANRTTELERYRKKCEQLAEQVQAPETLGALTARVQQFVRLHIADDIAELLRLNRRARDDYMAAVLEDEKTWATTLGSIAALASGHPGLSVGAGIGAVASLGAKALRAARERRETLRTSDFRIVYRMSRVSEAD
jgi:hypothetical protein